MTQKIWIWELCYKNQLKKIIQTLESYNWNEDEVKDDQREEILSIPSNPYYEQDKELLTLES